MPTTFREIIAEQMPLKPLAAILVIIALSIGYGLWTTTNTGTLLIHSPVYGARVFVDEHLAGISNESSGDLRLPEPAGKHNVIVSKEGFWPWTKNVEIKKHETRELYPFLVPQKIALEVIPRSILLNGTANTNTDYEKAASLFENLAMKDEIKLLVEATRIQDVSYADYAPGRTDVLLIAAKDGIFAVEIEKNEHPNFQPVYKGTKPLFVKTEENTLYIKDGDLIFRAKRLDQ